MTEEALLTPEEIKAREAFFKTLDDTEKTRQELLNSNKDAIKTNFFDSFYIAVRDNQQETFRKIDLDLDKKVNLNSVTYPVYQTDYYRGRQIKNDEGKVISEGTYIKTTFSVMLLGLRIEASTMSDLLTALGAIKA